MQISCMLRGLAEKREEREKREKREKRERRERREKREREEREERERRERESGSGRANRRKCVCTCGAAHVRESWRVAGERVCQES